MLISGGRLSRSEEAEYHRCLREMRAEGIDVNSPDDSPEHVPALDITVVGGLVSLIFNLPSGLAGYAIWLRLVARRSGLILSDCEITTKSDDQIVLECFDLGGPDCRLGQCRHHKSEVLNDRFPLIFHRRGQMVEGVILATGLKPIPKEYVQGMTVPFQLTVWDQFRNEINVESKLSVDRSTTPRPRLARLVSSLFDPERIPEKREPFVGKDPGVSVAVRSPIGKEAKVRRTALPPKSAHNQPKGRRAVCIWLEWARKSSSSSRKFGVMLARKLLTQSRELLKRMQVG